MMRTLVSIASMTCLVWVSLTALPGCSRQSEMSTDADRVRRDPDQPLAKEIINGIGMKLMLIPSGSFTMGSRDAERQRYSDSRLFDDEIPHQVTFTRDIYMGVLEVTQSQYQRVMGTNPSYFQGDKVEGDSSDLPVESLTWDEAVAFCERLSEMPEERAEGRSYRLPTEAEWEYACRAGTDTAYAFGDDPADLAEHAWFEGSTASADKRTQPAGQLKANAWGLHDMHGNVWEWCADWYGPYPTGPVTDPTGPEAGEYRLRRGGGWNGSAVYCRSAYRLRTSASARDSRLGFRVAMTLEP